MNKYFHGKYVYKISNENRILFFTVKTPGLLSTSLIMNQISINNSGHIKKCFQCFGTGNIGKFQKIEVKSFVISIFNLNNTW